MSCMGTTIGNPGLLLRVSRTNRFPAVAGQGGLERGWRTKIHMAVPLQHDKVPKKELSIQ